ncbi:RICIN domain-containing protein [Paenibacillus larvae]|uniref:putative mucin/carbohydrate-binding domain-containing protein n=1 Tax=Paenibacillus larvae TaxID=1464 RepID=UPI00227F3539|nr:putative mucin/carbohydrate-binding domain-containing protein [Paenibacillus larvae]MCY9508778.1 RICIN domain-containing protein [Paenibacillus larvae]MCY9527372.1 RICIN domain-containing protein [Paenibacillus larvae]
MDKTLKTQDEYTNIIVKFKDQALQSTPLVLKEENTLTQGHVDFFSDFSGLEFNRLIFTVSPEDMIQDMKTYSLPEDLGLFRYYSVQISKEQGDPQSIVDRLKQSPLVETAYIELPYVEFDGPVSVIAMEDLTKHEDVYAQPDRNPLSYKQGYLKPAPLGIDAQYSWSIPGGEGEGITIVDMENGWSLDHEDLMEQQIENIGSTNTQASHGTAVLGEVVGSDNEIGIIGTSPKAQAKVHSWYPQVAAAIIDTVLIMKPGDVLLLEGQYNRNGLVPIEVGPAEFDAIKYATNKGITVVEAGANGAINLDTYKNEDGKYIFNRKSPDFKDSGAIMVGAGSSYIPHIRLGFSDYGSRIDVYAWGNNVTTTTSDNNDPSKKYTDGFNGTSSASPIIAGAAVNLQGIAKANLGKPFTPKEVRDLLSDPSTGTPSNNPSSDKIGVMPDLKLILNKLGFYSTNPIPPTGLHATDIQTNSVALKWNPSESINGIKEYEVYRNGIKAGVTFSTEYTDTHLVSNTQYKYTVKAVDTKGNVSYGSNEIMVKTKHQEGILEGNHFAWSMKGYNDYEFARIDFDKKKEEMQIQLRSGTPHQDFNEIYASITVQDSSGEAMYEKDIFGNEHLNNETKHLSVKIGDIIVLKHKEGGSRSLLINVDDNKQESFGTWIAYELTKNGLNPLLGLEATDIQTDSVTLQWTPYDFDENQSVRYNVYLNGHYEQGVFKPFTTIVHLQPNTEYTIKIAAADDNWNVLQFSNEIKVKTKQNEEELIEEQIVTALNDTSVVDLNRSNNEIILWSNNGGDNQKWKFAYDKNKEAYQIKSVYDKDLVLAWNAIPNSKQVFATPNQYKEEHYWLLEATGDGYYIVKNKKNPNLVLDVADSKTSNGSEIIVYKQNNGKNQKFKLRKV